MFSRGFLTVALGTRGNQQKWEPGVMKISSLLQLKGGTAHSLEALWLPVTKSCFSRTHEPFCSIVETENEEWATSASTSIHHLSQTPPSVSFLPETRGTFTDSTTLKVKVIKWSLTVPSGVERVCIKYPSTAPLSTLLLSPQWCGWWTLTHKSSALK